MTKSRNINAELPILFNAPMVRAVLNDTKTMTRRIAKLTDAAHVKEPRGHRRWHPADPEARLACPYGQPGDRLWVREAWLKTNPFTEGGLHTYGYRASDEAEFPDSIWKPSIHMPRVASRITLEIVSVRVERLQDISEADARAEGVARLGSGRYHCGEDKEGEITSKSAVTAYAWLWNSINGPDSWAANPWVWVVQFRKIAT